MKKIRVAVLFGGKSTEHEVSVITGIQAIENFDREKFDVFPIYVTKEGKWYSGPELANIETFRKIHLIPDKATQVVFSFDKDQKGFRPVGKKTINLFNRSSDILPIDVILPTFHGGLGENGGFAGLFETMDLPYVGPGITGGTLAMDKVVMKQLFEQENIAISKWFWFYRNAWNANRKIIITKIEEQLKYPLFVKPATGGSSIGTTKVHSTKELENAIEVAVLFDRKIVVEESVENAREFNISVMGNAGSELAVSVCEEVFSSNSLLTYEDKYMGEELKMGTGAKSQGMLSTKRQLPANISRELSKKMQMLAMNVFETLDGSGVSRIDFLYQEKTNKIFVIESNTIPGCLSFYLWDASGLKYKDMLTKLIDLAFERYNDSKENSVTFSTNILENFKVGGSKGSKI